MQVDYVPFVNGLMIPDYEGGYGWDKGDSGGPTKYGITCYDLAEHRGQKMNSMSAWAPLVQAMTLSEADDIYRTKYATAIGFDGLPAGPDCCEMDYGVNSGLGRVKLVRAELLKKAGKPSVDACDPKWYVDAMCQERQAFLNGLGQRMPQFLKGWTARVNNLRSYCEHLAANQPAPALPVPVPSVVQAAPKASHTDPNLSTHVTTAVTGVGAGTGTAIHQGLSLPEAVALGVVGGTALLLWAAWRAHQNEVLNTTVVLPATIPPHP
jgi:lysozyme family protein